MKMKTLLAAAVLFFGASTAALAQNRADFSVISTQVTNIVATGHTEAVGTITFKHPGGAVMILAESTLVIQMPTVVVSGANVPVPITFPELTQANKGKIVGGSLGGGAAVSVSPTSSNSLGKLVLIIEPNTTVGPDATIEVFGLRISPASTPGLTAPVVATLSQTGDVGIVSGQNRPEIVSAISDALRNVNVDGDPESVTFKATDDKGSTGSGVITIKENFSTAFQSASQLGGALAGVTTSTNVRLTLSQIPPGLEVTFPTTVSSADSGLGVSLTRTNSEGQPAGGVAVFDAGDGANATVYYRIEGPVSAGDEDVMKIPFDVLTTLNPPLSSGRVTVTASFAPPGSAFDGTAVITDVIPRYAEKTVEGGQIIGVAANITALMFTHVLNISSLNFNCGFAIANTTTDPEDVFTNAATRQAGTVTFHFFPAIGPAIPSYTTKAGSPGTGLDATGQVTSGRTYLVLLSELLAAAGVAAPADFQGYVIAVTDFSNAHAISFVMERASIVQAQAALVMSASRDPIESLNN